MSFDLITPLYSRTKISEEAPSIARLVEIAKDLHNSKFSSSIPSEEVDFICAAAPGRVNLIGEHTDYTGGFVFPMAIEYSTVCFGRGSITNANPNSSVGKCQVISANQKDPQVIDFEYNNHMTPFPKDNSNFWVNYIIGVVEQYREDLKGENLVLSFQICIYGDVPLGSGLSSSASLEVSVATFIEALISKYKKYVVDPKSKALRCRKAENDFCDSPCGIMDQYVSAAALSGSALLIDCRTLEYEAVIMGSKALSGGEDEEKPVFLICNSNVKHSIGGGEYPVRVMQCKEATEQLRAVCGEKIESLRDATLLDIELTWNNHGSAEEDKSLIDDVIKRRAKHVVTENKRTQLAKEALLYGKWEEFGKLMNESHNSMKVDYQVSCAEIDILVESAQSFEGVYGSRLTGGGFGGCTVTLVKNSTVESLCNFLLKEYKAKTGKECSCFVTNPGVGAREVILR